jgi:hypothetical protein
MKKILGLLVVIAFCSSTFAARAGIKIAGNAGNSRVANISVITLGKCIGDTTTLTGGDSPRCRWREHLWALSPFG